MRGIWLLILILVLAAGGVAWWRQAHRPPAYPAERLTLPRKGSIARSVLAVGRVEARTRVELKSKANGIIRRLHVDVADRIEQGQLLIELDQEILEAALREASGRAKAARGAQARAQAMLQRNTVEREDPEIAYASRNWERAQRLHVDGLISDDEHDSAKDRFEKAQYRLRLLDAEKFTNEAAVLAAQGALEEVEAAEELARQELSEARIVSPISGVVLHRYLEEGDSVSSIRVAGGNATTILTLGDLSELYVDGEVDEVDVGKIIDQQRIRPDLMARVSVESFKGRTFPGRVARIAPLGLQDSNGIVTFEVRITLDNPERLLLANMTANSQIILEEKSDVLLLSQGALINAGGERYALVYDPKTGKERRQEVVPGISDGTQVEVANDLGLAPDEKIVIP